jgi:hypothetical protein
MRSITTHHDGSVNYAIRIEVLEPGRGGAPLRYRVLVPNAPGSPYGSTYHLHFLSADSGGLTNEVLLAIALDRLAGFQQGPFPCEANELAADCIAEALRYLKQRTRERLARGVAGKQEA